uniref:Uncharacterized protein n=1 Tax=Anopheles atroparvus TaxID=41427 RepID=A0A182JIQ7_ANOAO
MTYSDYGILVGIGVNCCFLLYLMSTPRLTVERLQISELRVLLIGIDQSLAFSAVERLRDWTLKQVERYDGIDLVVIDGFNVHFIDMTTAKTFVEMAQDLQMHQTRLMLWRFEADIAYAMLRMRKELFLPMLRADAQLPAAISRWKHLHYLPSDDSHP